MRTLPKSVLPAVVVRPRGLRQHDWRRRPPVVGGGAQDGPGDAVVHVVVVVDIAVLVVVVEHLAADARDRHGVAVVGVGQAAFASRSDITSTPSRPLAARPPGGFV